MARSQGWDFITPDMPWPILFDLEQEIRRLNLLSVALAAITFEDFIHRLKNNQTHWFNSTPSDSQYPCFDNLGLSGALVCDLYQRTSANSKDEIDKLTNNQTQPITNPLNVGDLHLAINGWFTLNPSHNPDWDTFTPLKWAEVREPRRLMVQIGHNHGLFQFGFEAKDQGDPATGFTQKGSAPFQQPPDEFWTQWQKLADGLAALPKSIETILIVLLPKVGAVASLAPSSDRRTDGYADFYEPAWVFAVLSGRILAGSSGTERNPRLAHRGRRSFERRSKICGTHRASGSCSPRIHNPLGVLPGITAATTHAERRLSSPPIPTQSSEEPPAFIPKPNILSGAQVQIADETIRDVINPKIRQIVTDAATVTGTQARVKFLDAWAVFDGYDYKDSLQVTRRIWVNTKEYVDNRYLNGAPPLLNLPWLPGNRLVEGGFQSVDGMHPSGAGYAVLASKALKLLGLKSEPSLLQTAFAEDKLLSQYPVELDYLGSALHVIRNAQHANHFLPDLVQPLNEQSHIAEILHAMATVFHP